MIAKLRKAWRDINASYWFYPAIFALLAVGAATFSVWLDRNGFTGWLNTIEAVQPARPEGARAMLTVIAGSMIGVASTVFSITIAAVAYASGNYGPRLLTNFMEDRGNQVSLATFIGTFVYAITVLRSVRAEDEASMFDSQASTLPGFVPQLSLIVAYVLMALSVAVLVFFLNHVPASIRINTVLKNIGQRLLDAIRDEYPRPATAAQSDEEHAGVPITAAETGYIQVIEHEALDDLAQREKGRLWLSVRAGDFVHPERPLAHWCPDADGEDDETPADAVRDHFAVGSLRSPAQDMRFLIDELVEIALRALSPGINDPFTAVTALHWLGAATAELAHRDLRQRFCDDDEEPRLFVRHEDFEGFVRRGFGAMRGALATSRIAALVALDVMAESAITLTDADRRDLIRSEGERLMAQVREALTGPDLDEVEGRFAAFEQRMAQPATG